MKIVNKPWGHEKWIVRTDKYVLKEIFMKAGCKSSLQYHKVKEETNYIIKGRAVVTGIEGGKLGKGGSFTILPHEIHRVEALTDLTMIEVSTPEVDDIIRIMDDYNRPNGRVESEHQ